MIHFALWKHTLIALTKKGMQGTPIDTDAIIERSKGRIKARLTKLKIRLVKESNRAAARVRPPRVKAEQKWTAGIGEVEVDELTAHFVASEALESWLT